MRIRSAVYLATLMLVLAACGRPDAAGIASSTQSTQPPATPPTARDDVANLLQKPPAPGASFELDAYVWRGGDLGGEGSASINHDAHGCPMLSAGTTLLTDQPVPWVLPILPGWYPNAIYEYPPASATWLVVNGTDRIPYHARLRGHLGDPSAAQCNFAKHIFTVERVVTTYAQDNPDLGDMKVPDTFPNWPRYHDPDLGYSFRYPSDWTVETLPAAGLVAALAVRSPQHPDNPILIRVHAGETYADPYDSAHKPPLLKTEAVSGSFLQDNIFIKGIVDRQHLTGYFTQYDLPDRHAKQTTVFFSAGGRTYELLLRYPIGMDASRELAETNTLFVLSFGFDVPPGPTPTPPIKQQLGKGPFLEKDQVLALLRKTYGSDTTWIDGTLLSEAAARKNPGSCNGFQSHPDGVWVITIHGVVEDRPALIQLFADASTGSELCSQELLDPNAPTPTPLQTATPTPAPYPAP